MNSLRNSFHRDNVGESSNGTEKNRIWDIVPHVLECEIGSGNKTDMSRDMTVDKVVEI